MAKVPYASAWRDYYENGYTPLPLPPREKFPPPFGWTGGGKANSGKVPPEEQCKKWATEGYGGSGGSGGVGGRTHKASNIALRLPKDVVGIDVDMYDGKAGRATLAAAEERWGELPQTWMSTSRGDGSGIRLFRVPAGLAWESQVGGAKSGIEVIRWDHRYAVVFPSVHPNGEQYHWVDPAGDVQMEWVPAPEELADMPEAWVQGLTNGGQEWRTRPEAELSREEISEWMLATPGAEAAMCDVLSATVSRGASDMEEGGVGGGLHDAALKAVWGVLRDTAQGHAGVLLALSVLKGAFRAAAGKRGAGQGAVARRLAGIDGEWFRIVSMGVCKVAAEFARVDAGADPCAATSEGEWKPLAGPGLRALFDKQLDLNDQGNALRFHHLYREDVHWLAEEAVWLTWKGERWERDLDGAVERLAMRLPAVLEEEAKRWRGDPDYDEFAKSLQKHAKATGRRGARVSLLEDVKVLKDVTLPAQRLDANNRLLACANGVVELLPSGARFRAGLRGDYCSLNTGVEYMASASHSIWKEFLEVFLPDMEIRDFAQRLVGYSLLGGNPERLFPMVMGQTTSGKSFFASALGYALGGYAGVFQLSMLRGKQHSDLNPALVQSLSRRIVIGEEASPEWHLHADEIKRLTGETVLSGRLPFAKRAIERYPAFTPWLATNNMPTIEGTDKAVKRRLCPVPFRVELSPEREKKGLREQLSTGTGPAAVLAWAVEGWNMYCRSGIAIPASAVEFAREQHAELNHIEMFISEECEIREDFEANSAKLYEVYGVWCGDNQVKERDQKDQMWFGRYLTGLGYPSVGGAPAKKRGGRFRRGLRLRSE